MPGTEVTSAVAPEVRDLSRRLLPDAAALGVVMAERIQAEVPFYAAGDVITREELDSSCADNIRYVLGRLSGEPYPSPDIPVATGVARASGGVPYAAVLQAFRVGGRYIWEILVERADPGARSVLLMAAADIWAVSDDLSTQVTDAYRSALTERARRDGQMRAVLVGGLLDGDSAAVEELWASVDSLELKRAGDYVVVSAECPLPGEEGVADAERELGRNNLVSAWRLDRDHQDGLVALRVGFGVEDLAERLRSVTSTRVGISVAFSRLGDAPEARRQARVACAAATPGSREVVRFETEPIAILLASTPDQAEALARSVLGPVLDLPPADRDVVLETARTWLHTDGSSAETGRRLHLHRNTVRYRLRRLEELTGRDLAKPVDAAAVHLALESVRLRALA